MDSPLREGGGGKGLSTKEKNNTFLIFFFVCVLLTTKPRERAGGAKGHSGLSTFFLFAASLTKYRRDCSQKKYHNFSVDSVESADTYLNMEYKL